MKIILIGEYVKKINYDNNAYRYQIEAETRFLCSHEYIITFLIQIDIVVKYKKNDLRLLLSLLVLDKK